MLASRGPLIGTDSLVKVLKATTTSHTMIALSANKFSEGWTTSESQIRFLYPNPIFTLRIFMFYSVSAKMGIF